jgi:hypothetical protein
LEQYHLAWRASLQSEIIPFFLKCLSQPYSAVSDCQQSLPENWYCTLLLKEAHRKLIFHQLLIFKIEYIQWLFSLCAWCCCWIFPFLLMLLDFSISVEFLVFKTTEILLFPYNIYLVLSASTCIPTRWRNCGRQPFVWICTKLNNLVSLEHPHLQQPPVQAPLCEPLSLHTTHHACHSLHTGNPCNVCIQHSGINMLAGGCLSL